MENSNTTMLAVVLIVGLVIGAGIGYFAAPSGTGETITETVTVEVQPLDGMTIQLGYVASNTVALETAVPHVNEMLMPEYNAYAKKLGYDVDFEYLVDDATGQAAVHLEKVQGFKSMDVNVFIGGGWSSQAQAALSYVNDNDMLMWSSSSTSPLLAIPDDNLYRMCPTDLIQAPAISAMLHSRDIDAIILIQRGDAWADGIYNYLVPEYEEAGGVVLERIRYAAEATEFANYLQTAEDIASDAVAQYGEGKVAIEIISFLEAAVMLSQAADFPTVYGLPWFGSDGTAQGQVIRDDAGQHAMHVGLFSTVAAPAESSKWLRLKDAYSSIVGQTYGYYSACVYDIGWVLTESILQAQSTDANDLIPIQHDVAYNNFGASGWNLLNADGDRASANYLIWSYDPEHVSVGLYDAVTGGVTWDIPWNW